jgi:adenylate cyclase
MDEETCMTKGERGESNLSVAVEIACRIASQLDRTSSRQIGAVHLLYGIMCVEKLDKAYMREGARTQATAEVEELKARLDRVSLNPQLIRRQLRRSMAASDSGIPSVGQLDASASATQIPSARLASDAAEASDSRTGKMTLTFLTHYLLQHEPVAALLDLPESEFKLLIHSLGTPTESKVAASTGQISDISDENLSIYASLDATIVAKPEVNWSVIGRGFSALCELSWEAGTAGKIQPLFEKSLRMLVDSVHAAQQGAILLSDCATGDLLLKAHYPKTEVAVSVSSARKAMDQCQSFVWERGADLSQSQIESDLWSGLYAPLIANGQSFGVICLSARASAARFTDEDLFLTTSLGHHLGLMLANRQLKEKLEGNARLLTRLMPNFSPQVRACLLEKARNGRLKLGGQKSVISILCSDIRGFTNLTADLEAEDVVDLLNDYFSALVSCVFRHGGSIDKFIGDAVLAVFGSPVVDSAHHTNSLLAALDMQEAARLVSAQRRGAGLKTCEIGIGVHTGEVIHGFIGSAERMEYTVIGSAVNLASRYCAAAGGDQIIISTDLYERVWKSAVVEAIGITTKHEGSIPAYRLLKMRS